VVFSALIVCTGNICRSPAAEMLLRARLGERSIAVSSAGTSGLSGHDMDAPSARAVREFGVDPSDHVARRLTAAMVAAADLVLTADAEHRSIIVQAQPLVFRRAFTLREFARLGAELPALDGDPGLAALRERVAAVAEQRGRIEAGAPGSDDIGDPFGAGFEVARNTVQAVSAAVDGVIHALGIRAASTASTTHDPGRESTLP
jgi:protein-tyrosine phosphatase